MADILIGIVGTDYTYYSLLYFTLPSVFRFTYPIFGSKIIPCNRSSPKLSKTRLKVADYNPATFVKLNSL